MRFPRPALALRLYLHRGSRFKSAAQDPVRDAKAANRVLELLGRELSLFIERKEVGKPGDFDHLADDELTAFIEAAGQSRARA